MSLTVEEEKILDSDELLKRAIELKNDGNKLFAEESYSEAIDKYTDALGSCTSDFTQIRMQCWGNIAACHIKTMDWKSAAESSAKALEIDVDYLKALRRRAYANEMIGSSESLKSSIEDYQKIKQLTKGEEVQIDKIISRLSKQMAEQQQQEMQEALSKLKDLGNTILSPFGLNTDMFQFKKNESGEGYSVNINKDK